MIGLYEIIIIILNRKYNLFFNNYKASLLTTIFRLALVQEIALGKILPRLK
jgi:hypothetical protein